VLLGVRVVAGQELLQLLAQAVQELQGKVLLVV
jgi:hypothetical protein